MPMDCHHLPHLNGYNWGYIAFSHTHIYIIYLYMKYRYRMGAPKIAFSCLIGGLTMVMNQLITGGVGLTPSVDAGETSISCAGFKMALDPSPCEDIMVMMLTWVPHIYELYIYMYIHMMYIYIYTVYIYIRIIYI